MTLEECGRIEELLKYINELQDEREALVVEQETLRIHISNQNKEIRRLTLLAELGNKRADDYRAMRDRALKAEEEVKQLKKEVEHNYEIRREASSLLKTVEKNLPVCYEEQRVIGINQLLEKAEEFAEVVFGDVAVRLSDLRTLKNEMAGEK